MSFNSDVKEELARVAPVCSHCERALLAALIRIEGTLFISGQGRYRLEIVTDAPSVARLSWRLLHEAYELRTELTTRQTTLSTYLRKKALPMRCATWACWGLAD